MLICMLEKITYFAPITMNFCLDEIHTRSDLIKGFLLLTLVYAFPQAETAKAELEEEQSKVPSYLHCIESLIVYLWCFYSLF